MFFPSLQEVKDAIGSLGKSLTYAGDGVVPEEDSRWEAWRAASKSAQFGMLGMA